jgi:hypothetical protein
MASAALVRALRHALDLERMLQRKPNAASTRREVDAAVADIHTAALADPTSLLPEPLVEKMFHLIKSNAAPQAALGISALWKAIPGSGVCFDSARLLQVRKARITQQQKVAAAEFAFGVCVCLCLFVLLCGVRVGGVCRVIACGNRSRTGQQGGGGARQSLLSGFTSRAFRTTKSPRRSP